MDSVNSRGKALAKDDLASSFNRIIQQALAEDIGDGDITTEATVAANAIYEGRLVAKAAGVIAGLDALSASFALANEACTCPVTFAWHKRDGDAVLPGELIGTVAGSGRTLLSAERTALNLLQRMSGIATLTRQYVDAVAGTKAIILDTRKTAPGLRMLDKRAVKLGGGANHRIGLYDMVLLKENHIAAAGGISAAVHQVRLHDTRRRKIEVEVRDLDELQEALALNVDQIMLDNMSLDQMHAAVAIVAGAVPLEASGNVTLETVRAIAESGVDYISVGKLTHSVTALDISFLLTIVTPAAPDYTPL